MKNPIEEIRQKNNWSIQELATVTDMSFTAVYNVLNGNTFRINWRILDVLSQLGYDPQKIKREYREYREAKKQELLQEAE